MNNPLNLQKGDRVLIHLPRETARTVEALVLVASGNGKSLMLSFDALFSGYLGLIPLLWSDEEQGYIDLIQQMPVGVRKIP